MWIVASSSMVALMVLLSFNLDLMAFGHRMNTAILRAFASIRAPWLTSATNALNTFFEGWGTTALGLATVALVMIFRRWRHLIVLLGATAAIVIFGDIVYTGLATPRPFGVEIIGNWGGYSTPSPPVAMVTATALAIVYTLVPPGRPRSVGKLAGWTLISVFGLVRMYLAVDHPGGVVFAVAFAAAIVVPAFRWFCPNEAFPVVYRRGKTAHLDVGGQRGEAIRQAIREQLGLTVLEVKPVGLAGSSGSTPLRMRVAGDPDTFVFAKLYARSHVRADRWYKLWRTILYGALEDEAPFHTVRRLVEYEDYTSRLLRDASIPTAEPYGIVEITPEREYMFVTEFFDGAVEISEAEIDATVIDSGLRLIRDLWDAGVAHRDIKPANLLVRNGEVLLIDVFFAQVRPSPWRQAVDLGNMMLVLAMGSDSQTVYDRALRYFMPDELAEAFAATRGVASPSQLRALLKKDGRNLIAEFRELAPKRRPIVLQRWSVKRLGLALAMLGAIVLFAVNSVQLFVPLRDPPVAAAECGTNATMVLAAQAVPTASLIPCLDSLPSGWRYGMTYVHRGGMTFTLDSDQAGLAAVAVTFAASCDTSRAIAAESTEPGTKRFDRTMSIQPTYRGIRYYTFPGGCASYRFAFAPNTPHTRAADAERELTFIRRGVLVEHVEQSVGLPLCGRGADCSL